ncbi:MAG: glycosyltransferase [Vampirovibrionales bacterium]|nr:glycosyltransferase [Vampirovibrionales bacterium]
MAWFFQLDTWLILVGAILLIRQLFVIFAAEQGRKADLVKKRYRSITDQNVTALVTWQDPGSGPALKRLLEAIEAQEYPSSRVSVYLGLSPELQAELSLSELSPNVRVCVCPDARPTQGQLTAWLIERCLAAGDCGVITFFRSDDVIKPDYFLNVVAASFDFPVMQGMVAMRRRQASLLGQVAALSRRLRNRIANAGRFHLGLSCRLQDSGWAVKQDILEMIPYRRGHDLDNLEYALRLKLGNIRVGWAPAMVTYSDRPYRLFPVTMECALSALNRLRLAAVYSAPLLVRAVIRGDLTALEEFLTVLKPPDFITGAIFLAFALVAWQTPLWNSGHPAVWTGLFISVVTLHLLSMAVARCKPADYLTGFIWTPVVYLLGGLMLPAALAYLALGRFSRDSAGADGRSYKSQSRTRFNETIDPELSLFDTAHRHESGIRDLLVTNAPLDFDDLEKAPLRRVSPSEQAQLAQNLTSAGVAAAAEPVRQDRVVEKSIPISNGQRQVDCVLQTHTRYNEQGSEIYQMALYYKTVSFSTQSYRILDQAFYELETKLLKHGLTMVTCGSCGYFYNPVADVPDAVKSSGVCLFGKKGRDVNLSTDAVTVISQACPYHSPLDLRETIVREWRDSLSAANM